MKRRARIAGLLHSFIIASRGEMEGGGNTVMMDGSGTQVDEYLGGRTYVDNGFDPMFPYKGKCRRCKNSAAINEAGTCYYCLQATAAGYMT
jgi:hypothetical protein